MDSLLATKEMCAYCFDVLESVLQKKAPQEYPAELPQGSAPLFVTWHCESGSELRGCIGTFSNQPLMVNLGQYALVSAL